MMQNCADEAAVAATEIHPEFITRRVRPPADDKGSNGYGVVVVATG